VDGPGVAPPKLRGFGNSLIKHGLSVIISASVRLAHLPKGLVCKLTVSLAHFQADE
jgi:hypothetical protein